MAYPIVQDLAPFGFERISGATTVTGSWFRIIGAAPVSVFSSGCTVLNTDTDAPSSGDIILGGDRLEGRFRTISLTNSDALVYACHEEDQ